jgi:hypothetical protein
VRRATDGQPRVGVCVLPVCGERWARELTGLRLFAQLIPRYRQHHASIVCVRCGRASAADAAEVGGDEVRIVEGEMLRIARGSVWRVLCVVRGRNRISVGCDQGLRLWPMQAGAYRVRGVWKALGRLDVLGGELEGQVLIQRNVRPEAIVKERASVSMGGALDAWMGCISISHRVKRSGAAHAV